jgi:hypothetical protein
VQELNAKRRYRGYIGTKWLPLDAEDEATAPFCTMVNGSDIRYCGGLEATPWSNEMIEEFAERAIEGEQMGHHRGVDVLAIGLSANDYVGHAVGPDDPAVRDISIRTDRLLGKLLEFVDQRIGSGNTLVVLTADHGVAPLPEVNQARKMPGGRLSELKLRQKMTAALTRRFGPGEWFLPGPITTPYLNLSLVRTRRLDSAEVERTAADAARAEEHIARVYTRRELLNGAVQNDQIGAAVSAGFYGPRSGDLFILPEPYYLFEPTGTSHGTPYEYDTHVPLIFLGRGIRPGTYSLAVAINDVAPTLATLLGVGQPSGSIGRILNEMLERSAVAESSSIHK